jgi:hypothetical protein
LERTTFFGVRPGGNGFLCAFSFPRACEAFPEVSIDSSVEESEDTYPLVGKLAI